MTSRTSFEAQPPDFDPRVILDTYEQRQAERLASLRTNFNEAWSLASNTAMCNEHFEAVGRRDLRISEKAPMLPVTDMADFLRPNNFAPRFVMHSGPEETAFINTQQLEIELSQSVKRDLRHLSGHLRTRAFHRMAAICPSFTINLATTLSQPENAHNLDQFLPELFAAYQIMGELVDTSDPWVVDEGIVNEWYLHA